MPKTFDERHRSTLLIEIEEKGTRKWRLMNIIDTEKGENGSNRCIVLGDTMKEHRPSTRFLVNTPE